MIIEHIRNTKRGADSMFHCFITFSYLINPKKLFIYVQYDHLYQFIKNIGHQQEVHQDFYVENQTGKTTSIFI